MNKILTPDLILQRTKTDNLFSIKNLNLWGNELEDLSLLSKMPNLEVLSLSVNKISSLKDFATCSKLQELYLRKNNISDLTEIRYLMNLRNLKVLWLWDNPCADETNYRDIVIKCLPSLVKLDNSGITPEERAQGSKVNIDFIFSKNSDSTSDANEDFSRGGNDPYIRKKSQPSMPVAKNYSPSYQYKENYEHQQQPQQQLPGQGGQPVNYQYQRDQSITTSNSANRNIPVSKVLSITY
jgi:cilla- and flagella-associated protein